MKIPEGFRYSRQAQLDLLERAKKATKEIIKRCKNDPELRKRVKQLTDMFKSFKV